MDTNYIKKYIEKYEDLLEQWDKESSTLTKEGREEYKQMREAFKNRAQAWERMSEMELESFKQNLDESFRQIEALWHRIKPK